MNLDTVKAKFVGLRNLLEYSKKEVERLEGLRAIISQTEKDISQLEDYEKQLLNPNKERFVYEVYAVPSDTRHVTYLYAICDTLEEAERMAPSFRSDGISWGSSIRPRKLKPEEFLMKGEHDSYHRNGRKDRIEVRQIPR